MNNLTTLYIIRHGESELNERLAKGEVMQTGDYSEFGPPLTKNGRTQATQIAEKLKNIHFDAAFSSDLIRAKETAEIITLERNIAVSTTKVIRETHWGSDEGKFHSNFEKIQEDIKKLVEEEKMHFKFEDAETEEEAVTRLITFVREVAVGYTGKTVMIVCHGNIMRMFLIKLGFAAYDELPPRHIENTGYFVLQSDGVDFFIKETHGVHKVEVN